MDLTVGGGGGGGGVGVREVYRKSPEESGEGGSVWCGVLRRGRVSVREPHSHRLYMICSAGSCSSSKWFVL